MSYQSTLLINTQQKCLSLKVEKGQYSALRDLPQDVHTWSESNLTDFVAKLVNELIEEIETHRKIVVNKTKRKAKKCENGSTERLQKSEERTPLRLLST